MSNPYPHLFSPIRIGSITLKNRIVSAPNSLPSITADGLLGWDEISFFERKAMGGAAVITLGESIVHTATGKSHNRQLLLDNPNVLPWLTKTAKAISHHGAIANIELSHGGKHSNVENISRNNIGRIVYGPSEEVSPAGIQIHEMPKEIIEQIITSYEDAAKLVKQAGFGMLMIHAAHGWLFTQFLSPRDNRRKDEYGGSLENRARFLLQTLERVRGAVGKDFPIELRINGDDFRGADGSTLADYVEVCQMADQYVDLFNISAADHEVDSLYGRTHPNQFFDKGCNVYLAAEIKKHVKHPVACVGGITDPAMCEEIIASGKADLVEMGRALVADPDFPKKAYAGKAWDINPCIRCMLCYSEARRSQSIRCTVNPIIGVELSERFYNAPPEKRKKVLVIGGGPGGLEAAATAAKRGHDVTLCEKDADLGGMLRYASVPDFKKDLMGFVNCLSRRARENGVDIRLQTTVTPDYVRDFAPDALIVAIGGRMIIPKIPGIESEQFVMAHDAELHPERLDEQVVVMGGGQVGCETAICLTRAGKRVTVVEMRDDYAIDAPYRHRNGLITEMKRLNIPVLTRTTGLEVREDGLLCVNSDGNETLIPGGQVICAVGVAALSEEAEKFRGLTEEYYCLGDCVRARQAVDAVTEGYFIAKDL